MPDAIGVGYERGPVEVEGHFAETGGYPGMERESRAGRCWSARGLRLLVACGIEGRCGAVVCDKGIVLLQALLRRAKYNQEAVIP